MHDRLENGGVRGHSNARPNQHRMLSLGMAVAVWQCGSVGMAVCKEQYLDFKENLEHPGGWSAKGTTYVNMQGLVHLFNGHKNNAI